jgi:hypothetical protein
MLAVAASLLVFGTAAIGAEPVSFFGLVFPEQVQGAPRGQTTDYETTKPGLGYAAVYLHEDWTANVYIYDLGRKPISAGLASAEVTEQFNQAAHDVFAVGQYRDIVVGPRFTLGDGSGAERFVCRTFTFVHLQAGPARSALCLTSWRNKFVKFRLTTPDTNDVSYFMRAFAGDWIRILWPRP